MPECALGIPFNLRVLPILPFKFMKLDLFNAEPKTGFELFLAFAFLFSSEV